MTKDEFEVEEYRSLRAEILRAMEDGNQIMSFGLTAIGIVLTASVGIRETRLGFFMIAVIVPALSSLVLSMWFAAHERLARASFFISGIEARLKDSLNFGDVPTWDVWLRSSPKKGSDTQHHFWNTEFSGIAIFAFLMVGPLLLSLLFGVPAVPTVPAINLYPRILTTACTAIAVILYFVWFRRRVKRWRDWLSKSFGELD